MSSTTFSPEQQTAHLLRLFQAEMEKNLTDAAIAHIRPRIAEAAREVVRDLDAKIGVHYNHLADRMIVQFTGNVTTPE